MGEKVLTTKTGIPLQHPGSGMAYSSYGCRCDECRAFNTERNRIRREQRYQEDVPEYVTHGLGAAGNWGCKCDICREAVREQSAKFYQENLSVAARKRKVQEARDQLG